LKKRVLNRVIQKTNKGEVLGSKGFVRAPSEKKKKGFIEIKSGGARVKREEMKGSRSRLLSTPKRKRTKDWSRSAKSQPDQFGIEREVSKDWNRKGDFSVIGQNASWQENILELFLQQSTGRASLGVRKTSSLKKKIPLQPSILRKGVAFAKGSKKDPLGGHKARTIPCCADEERVSKQRGHFHCTCSRAEGHDGGGGVERFFPNGQSRSREGLGLIQL